MIHLAVQSRYQDLINENVLQRTAKEGLDGLQSDPSASFSISIGDDAYLKELNQTFREVNKTTDVLAFPGEFRDPDSGSLYLGDIAISFPRASRQAEAAGHDVEQELQLLVVHGLLHLLGYDHQDPEQRAHMWAAQRKILDQLGVDIPDPGEQDG